MSSARSAVITLSPRSPRLRVRLLYFTRMRKFFFVIFAFYAVQGRWTFTAKVTRTAWKRDNVNHGRHGAAWPQPKGKDDCNHGTERNYTKKGRRQMDRDEGDGGIGRGSRKTARREGARREGGRKKGRHECLPHIAQHRSGLQWF